jgi:hypothetical protein
MGSQVHLSGQESTAGGSVAVQPVILDSHTFSVPSTFSLRAVDPTSGVPGDDIPDPVIPAFDTLPILTQEELDAQEIEKTTSSEVKPHDDETLGGLDEFVGTFIGNGLNVIFRPRNEVVDPEQDNLLEINVTKETLKFLSRDVLGAIPNRGFGFQGGGRPSQRDVILRGVPYLQTISDLVDQASKTLREPGIAIHFEQGLFLRTPALVHPDIPATLSRLASIPHGTTINAQVEDPGFDWKTGPPKIREDANILDINPFRILDPTKRPVTPPFFRHLDLPKQRSRNRLPNKLQDFDGIHAIENHQDPLATLVDINAIKKIIKHRTFEFTTDREGKTTDGRTVPGGGTRNIAFLQGSNEGDGKKQTDANANAVTVTCRYWISVVQVEVTVPPTNHSKIEVTPPRPENTPNGVTYVHPTFIIALKHPLIVPTPVIVQYVQIQYAQNVTLDFGPLSWPHVSVATLIPGGAYGDGKVELNAEQLAKLGI